MDASKATTNVEKRQSFDPSSEEAWLNAHYDPVASLCTFSCCIDLEDLDGDGDYKLLVGDIGNGHSDMKLKIYKGTQLNHETQLLDLPTSVKTFMMDTHEPAVAVASGSHVFIYKTIRPYFKFTLPLLEINSEEKRLWTQLKDNEIDPTQLRDGLEFLNSGGCNPSLTVQSLTFLQLEAEDLIPFTAAFKQIPLKKQSVITCMSTLYKTHGDENSASCIVIGTENKDIYILDPAAFTFLSRMTLPAVPVFLSITGIYDIDYSISIACRDGCIYTIKKDFSRDMPSFPCISLPSQAVGIIRDENHILVGTMNRMLYCYTSRGKMLWSISLPDDITAMERMDYKMRDFKAIIIALANNEVRIYKDKYLVNSFKMEDVIVGMKFGQFGREEGSLILVSQSGALSVKILKRNAIFEPKETRAGPSQSQAPKLNVPKKTKAFVEQAIRERENATFMHQTFQQHLLQLKLETAKSYIKAVSSSLAPVTSSQDTCLTISAQVQGIGPIFKITVILQNTSPSTSLIDHYLIFQTNDSLYSISKKYIKLPVLVPSLPYSFSTMIECLDDYGRTDTVKVYVYRNGNPIPLLTAVIDMPTSENIVM